MTCSSATVAVIVFPRSLGVSAIVAPVSAVIFCDLFFPLDAGSDTELFLPAALLYETNTTMQYVASTTRMKDSEIIRMRPASAHRTTSSKSAITKTTVTRSVVEIDMENLLT